MFLGALAGDLHAQNTTTTTSTTQHDTHTAITIDQRVLSGLIQNIVNGGDQLRLEWTLNRPLNDPQVQAALQAALKVLHATKPGFPKGATLQLIGSSTQSGGASSSSTTQVQTGTNTSVTTQTTFGPATILIGPDQSMPFFVAPGTTNVNINTHTETFFNDITTLTGGAVTAETYLLQRILLLDLNAVFSTLFSGLPLALSQRDLLLNAHSGGIGDVNGHLFRAWLGFNDTEAPQGDGLLGDDVRLFTSGDFGWLSLDGSGGTADLDDTREAASVGLEWRLAEAWRLGVGVSYVHTDTDFGGDLGGQEIDGGALSTYLTWRPGAGEKWPACAPYVDLLYSVGAFDVDTYRGTLVSGTAHGSADSWSHLVSLSAGCTFKVSDNFVTGPFVALTYVHGHLDEYTEHGGGSAALTYDEQEFDSLISYVGWQANWKLRRSWGNITPLVHVGWERENLSDTGEVGATLVQSPFAILTGNRVTRFGGFGVRQSRESARYDAFVAGVGVAVDIGERWTLLLDAVERTDFDRLQDFSIGLRVGLRF